MPAGAALGAAGLGSALIGSSAAKSAAKTQAQAADKTAQLQLSMFNQIRDDLSPYRQVGSTALPGLMQLLGIGGNGITTGGGSGLSSADYEAYVKNNPDLIAAYNANPDYYNAGGNMGLWGQRQWEAYDENKTRGYTPQTALTGRLAAPQVDPRQAYLEATPGYQFARDQGIQAVTNSLNARGLGGLSGSLGKGLARFVTGLADQTYQKSIDNLMGVVNTGQNAATQTGSFGQQAATGAGNALTGGANAAAGGTIGSANAISGGLQGAANSYLTSRLLGMYGGGSGGGGGMNVPISGLY